MTTKATRPLYEIANEIRSNWTKEKSGTKLYFGAVPYLEAMQTLNSIKENYYMDSADSIVRYFLSNASTWRGTIAKRVKAELNAMLKNR